MATYLISFLLVAAFLASFSSTSSSLPLNFFPGPFAPPHPGHPGGSHPCARDFDFSDCDPEDASFFGLQSNAEARPAGDRGFKTYENGAVVPVEGPGLAITRELLYHALKLGHRMGGQPEGFPTVEEVLDIRNGKRVSVKETEE